MGFPYESKSLMHFDGMRYATGSNPTIVSKIPGLLLGNQVALTVQDIAMINKLYAQCKGMLDIRILPFTAVHCFGNNCWEIQMKFVFF